MKKSLFVTVSDAVTNHKSVENPLCESQIARIVWTRSVEDFATSKRTEIVSGFAEDLGASRDPRIQ